MVCRNWIPEVWNTWQKTKGSSEGSNLDFQKDMVEETCGQSGQNTLATFWATLF